VQEYQGYSVARAFKKMWVTEGVKGFFKGNGVNCLKVAPFHGIEFYSYDVYKSNMFKGKGKNELNYTERLICGSLTGITS